jgi:hypothetical protein
LLACGFQVDLVGGYYDAGDNVKFGLPMAFTTTLLAWSVIEFGSSMHDQLHNAKDAIKWSTDYLLKAATATPDTLYVQVSKNNMLLRTSKKYGSIQLWIYIYIYMNPYIITLQLMLIVRSAKNLPSARSDRAFSKTLKKKKGRSRPPVFRP